MREEGNAPKRGYPSRHQAAQAFPVSSESLLLSVEGKTRGLRDSVDLEHTLTLRVLATCGREATTGALSTGSSGVLTLQVTSSQGKDVFSKYWTQASHWKAALHTFLFYNTASTSPMWRLPSPIEAIGDGSTHWRQRLKIAR